MLCNKSPYPPSEGGPMAMNSIVNGLLNAGHKIKILAVNSEKYHITEKNIPKSYREKTSIELVDVDLRIKPIEAFKNLFTDKIESSLTFFITKSPSCYHFTIFFFFFLDKFFYRFNIGHIL